MKCRVCGAWTEVKDTRAGSTATRRRRVCANGHRFSTYEIHDVAWAAVAGLAEVVAEAAAKKAGLISRNETICKEAASGVPIQRIADKHGLKRQTIYLIIKEIENGRGNRASAGAAAGEGSGDRAPAQLHGATAGPALPRSGAQPGAQP